MKLQQAIMTEMGAPINLASGAQASVGMSHLKTAIRVLEKTKVRVYTHNNNGNYKKRTYWCLWLDHPMELANKSRSSLN